MISVLLASFLVASTLIVGYLAPQSPLASSHEANAPHIHTDLSSVSTPALNEYIETGNAYRRHTNSRPDALTFVPEHGAMGDDSALLTYLLALYDRPHPSFASLSSTSTPATTLPSPACAAQTPDVSATDLTGFFRVRDGRIVLHWSDHSRYRVFHTSPYLQLRVEAHPSGHLAIAELTFPQDQHELARRSMAQRSSRPYTDVLTLMGDGASQILDIDTGETIRAESEANARLRGPVRYPHSRSQALAE